MTKISSFAALLSPAWSVVGGWWWAGLLVTTAVHAGDAWPQFRGPTGDGHSEVTTLPVTFGETDHVKWKTAIHGKGWSSPVVWGNQIWLTTATPTGEQLSVICVDKTTGAIVRDTVLFRVAEPQFCHPFNSYASPTPVIEEGRVYVTFGSPGTACLDAATGKVLWQRTDFVCNHFRAAGSSPILHGDLLIMNFDGSDFQFVVALDKKTGKTVWQVNRSVDYKDLDAAGKPAANGDFRKGFSTPQVITWEGRPLLLSSGAKAHYAYEPATGAEVWRLEERAQHSSSSRPIVANGLVYFQTGFSKGQLLAVKLGGKGVLEDAQIAWREKKNVPNKPSIIVHEGLLTMADDNGIVTCLDAATGAEVWRERIPGAYSASPLLAAGRIYFSGENGQVTVLAAGRTFQKLAENKFESGFMASPAVAGSALILRTKTHLYRVE
jgi:outer membrane protein assembly factor BamB